SLVRCKEREGKGERERGKEGKERGKGGVHLTCVRVSEDLMLDCDFDAYVRRGHFPNLYYQVVNGGNLGRILWENAKAYLENIIAKSFHTCLHAGVGLVRADTETLIKFSIASYLRFVVESHKKIRSALARLPFFKRFKAL
ncbi:MAG: hypothetical protein ACKESB_01555, partial [Candidatus Hodgkinia cicadicola]